MSEVVAQEISSASKAVIRKLKKKLGSNSVYSDPTQCWSYGYDNSCLHQAPAAVIFPQQHEDVALIVKECYQEGIPIVPRGRGTGTTGAAIPMNNGFVLSFERMNNIIKFEPENRLIITQPGVLNQPLQDFLKPHGLFWASDPSSAAFCTIGGNLAYNSAGPRAIKYGTPRENTFGLKAVIGTGETVKAGVKTSKSVVGYDLTRLFIGSEGTLGIITEATLKLTPLPQAKQLFRVLFDDVKMATQSIVNIMSQPIIPCGLEFMDAKAIELINQYGQHQISKQAKAMLYVELDGNNETITHDANIIKGILEKTKTLSLDIAHTDEQSNTLWKSRKALSPTLKHIAPKKINEDVVVPVSNIPDLITGIESLAIKYQITIVNFGHAGNGNIHVNLLIDPDDPIQSKNATACLDALFDLVISLEGSLSGEHGIGLTKAPFIHREIDSTSLQVMKNIKQSFDPKSILNPGKWI